MVKDAQIRDTVADNVKTLRTEKGWTLEQLSDRLDQVGYPISLQVLWKTEQKRRKVTVDDLVGLARAFGVTVDRMLASPLVPDEVLPMIRSVAALQDRQHEVRDELDKALIYVSVMSQELDDVQGRIRALLADVREVLDGLPISDRDLIQHVEDRWGSDAATTIRDLLKGK